MMNLLNFNTEELISLFLSTCLDTVAPLKSVLSKPKSELWLNETTRAVRQECRRAERRWKKNKLRVSGDVLKECWRSHQKVVKAQKTKYFSDIILTNCQKPCVLFSTVSSILNAPQSSNLEASTQTCEAFLHFFVGKVASIRAGISPPSYDASVPATCSAIFSGLFSVWACVAFC